MNQVFLKSRAKINLSLDVVGKRDDGYHELRTVMQTLFLYDTIYMKQIQSNKIIINTNIPYLPTNEKNIIYKAAKLVKDEYSLKQGIFIDLNKSIPISAGLAGGSGNCAATLIGMRKLFNVYLPMDKLLKMGKSLGADVPFCILRGTALAEGIGDKLTTLSPHPKVYVLLITPNVPVSTKKIFKSLAKNNFSQKPKTDLMIKSINSGNIKEIAKNLSNQLEPVTANQYSIITEIKKAMMTNNALGAQMSGSGPTIFGYFKHKKDAYYTMDFIQKNFRKIRYCKVTSVFNPKKKPIKRKDNNVR